MEEIFTICDTITVMRDGRTVDTTPIPETNFMENQELNRYAGDYHEFKKVHEMKRQQLESAYKKQQQEISNLKDFVARNKARVSTRNMAMGRSFKCMIVEGMATYRCA